VEWEDGKTMETFVHASGMYGIFRFSGVDGSFVPQLEPPNYGVANADKEVNSLVGQSLGSLGYRQGDVVKGSQYASYVQEGWGGFKYHVYLQWEFSDGYLTGWWSIHAEFPGWEKQVKAKEVVAGASVSTFDEVLQDHEGWWTDYWNRSSIEIPDDLLQKQYYLEMYKFGSAARDDTPPISLQAVWTADDGKIPPWKGDFHHDLNTQLSYWPAYTGNHLYLEEGFVNWLWKYRETFKEYTRKFYGTDGLNVPGVTTLTGEPMGGWIQYSFSPTVSAWLAHHFYMHWQYTQDRNFLEQKAYPWIRDVAAHLEELSVMDEQGRRTLPLSSSPEIFNNSRKAWFAEITNYDLALIRWTFTKAAELAISLEKDEEAKRWKHMVSDWPGFAVDETQGLMFSPNVPYFESHRHFSHLMAIHPLGLIDISDGPESTEIISNTIRHLDNIGPHYWTGYSYSWEGNLKARAGDGEGAAEALRIFARAFCLPNSFHVNGDQTKSGYSTMTYRPFTLEGNFAFASGIQDMLIQSHTGTVHLFPAIPTDWKNVRFEQMRTYGAFLVSAVLKNGLIKEVVIESEKGGLCVLKNPFSGYQIDTEAVYELKNDVIHIPMRPGQRVILNIRQ
jgi:alpha-L-fucosidase 2